MTRAVSNFAETLGFLISHCPAVNYGLAHTKACERLKFRTLEKNEGNYETKLSINLEVQGELEWWKEVAARSVNIIRLLVYDLTIFTDASKPG